jgi:hypothetical protein
MRSQRNPARNQAVNRLRNSPSLTVALNWGMESSFFNALVNSFDKFYMFRGENSGYSGSKIDGEPRAGGSLDLPMIFQLAVDKRRIQNQLGAVVTDLRTAASFHLPLRRLGGLPTASVSIKLKLLLFLAETGANTPETMFPNSLSETFSSGSPTVRPQIGVARLKLSTRWLARNSPSREQPPRLISRFDSYSVCGISTPCPRCSNLCGDFPCWHATGFALIPAMVLPEWTTESKMDL